MCHLIFKKSTKKEYIDAGSGNAAENSDESEERDI
jgi:hypothetical protein